MKEAIKSISSVFIPSNVESLIGRTFGMLKVISFLKMENGRSIWICQCACGKQVSCRGNNLKTGGSKSCGCIGLSRLINRNTKHGKSIRGMRSLVYSCWSAMKTRATNPKATGSRNYFHRGIGMDAKWHKFECFYADMGDPPSVKHSLDRIDTNQGYSAINCRWADRTMQNNNRRDNVRVLYDGKLWTITELANRIGIYRRLLYKRLYLGWDVKRAISEPVRVMKKSK